MSEIWKDVVGYEGLYKVSSLGRVMRVRDGEEKLMKIRTMKDGRHQIGFEVDCVRKALYVHRMVCEAFNGPPPEGKTLVRHLDGNNQNNTPSNLKWGTHQENMDDMVRHGTQAKGTGVACSKLNDDLVRYARSFLNGDRIIAKQLSVSLSVAKSVRRGISWKHVH